MSPSTCTPFFFKNLVAWHLPLDHCSSSALLMLIKKHNYVRTFVSGTFTDDECRQQALSRTPVSHPTAVVWDSWQLTSENYVGEVNGRTFTVNSSSAANRPRLDPDQPFVFIRSEATSTTLASGSAMTISDTGYSSILIR